MKITIDLETAPQPIKAAIAQYLTGAPTSSIFDTPPVEPVEPIPQKPHTSVDHSGSVDHNGIIFDAQYCANAKEPFFSSGPRKGQWKKRVGVQEKDYDNWYASRLSLADDEEDAEGPEIDTSAAFSASKPEPVQAPAPEDAGKFYHWLAEMQAAGKVTSQDISAAYTAAGVGVNDLFPPTPAEKITASLNAIYRHISKNIND